MSIRLLMRWRRMKYLCFCRVVGIFRKYTGSDRTIADHLVTPILAYAHLRQHNAFALRGHGGRFAAAGRGLLCIARRDNGKDIQSDRFLHPSFARSVVGSPEQSRENV